MTRIPIACTLTVEDAEDRVGEWRAFFAAHTDVVEVRSPTEAAVRLRPGDEALLAAADLAGREKACCSFFAFSIALTEDARWLQMAVPEDAAPILSDFVTLAR